MHKTNIARIGLNLNRLTAGRLDLAMDVQLPVYWQSGWRIGVLYRRPCHYRCRRWPCTFPGTGIWMVIRGIGG